MNDRDFWALVEKTLSNDQATQCQRLTAELKLLTKDQLIGFDKAYRNQLATAYSWDLWAGAYIINGGCSDDGFDYFCDWLVSRGEATFTQAIQDPETLIDIATPWDTEFEDFRYVMGEVFEDKFGGDMPFSGPARAQSPSGDEWDEETVELKYPKLAKWINSSVEQTHNKASLVTQASPPKKSVWQRLFGKK